MAVWQNKFIKPSKWARPRTKLIKVKKIIIHWTANFGASADNHYRYFNNLTGRYASAHLFVDRKDKLCIVPINEVTYQANDVQRYSGGVPYRGVSALKPNANLYAVGIEMCVEKDGTIHSETIANAVECAVELCKIYGLNENDIVRHYDVTAKSCPTPFITDSSKFTAFKKAVKERLSGKTVTQVSNTIKDSKYYTSKIDNAKAKIDVTVYKDVEFKEKVGVAPKGSIMEVLKVEKTKKGTPRLKIKEGYITANKDYVAKISDRIGLVKVLVDDLTIRKSDSFNSKAVGKAGKNKEYEVIKESNGLYQIGNGKWISANEKYSKFTKKKISLAKALKLQKEKSESSKKEEDKIKLDAKKEERKKLKLTYKKYLQKNDKGNDVKALQKALNELGYNVGKVDGIFGEATVKGVKDFQKKFKLDVDGVAGKATFEAINKELSK